MPKRKGDPFADREAKKYEHPIPSREHILELLKTLNRLVGYQELAAELHLETEKDQEALRRRLIAMERDGQLLRGRRGLYGLIDKMDLICGFVEAHRDGFGFLRPEDHGDNMFISAHQMRALFNGDKVLVSKSPGSYRGKAEAHVVEVLERAVKQVAGKLSNEGGIAHVMPDDKRLNSDILIPQDQLGDAEDGQIVLAEITKYPTRKSQAIGKIVEVLGEHMAPGMEIDLAMRSHGVPFEWPEAVLKAVEQFAEDVPESDCVGREDLRHIPFVTIDGEDARDFDDAVHAESLGKKGWCISVAIADVSHYVKPGSALDEEGAARGNSVYFPSNVIPMLPEKLSNGLCSLNPHVDRLVLVCRMKIDLKGKIIDYQFSEAVIHSHQRFTYTKVAAILDGDEALREEHKDFLPMLETLQDVQKVLTVRREKAGAMMFETLETKIVFGEGRKIKEIVPVIYNEANRLIEECMLAANISAADFIKANDVHGIYRVHNAPNEDSVATLRETLNKLGLTLPGGTKPTPKDFGQVLAQAADRPDKQLITIMVLRSLNQAVYDVDLGDGHFGLAFDAYTHFTSPIRRYPDLLVHRIIRALLRKQKKALPGEKALKEAAAHCSMTERRADDATRDAVDWLKCEFMLDKVGQDFDGIITGVSHFGFFVQLESVYVEGLVHISNLDNDYYHFNADTFKLVGERSGASYALGDKVNIRVAGVSLDDRKIDFALVDLLNAPKASKKPAAKKSYKSKKKPDKKAGAKKKATAKKASGKKTGAAKKRKRRGKVKRDK